MGAINQNNENFKLRAIPFLELFLCDCGVECLVWSDCFSLFESLAQDEKMHHVKLQQTKTKQVIIN